MQRLRSTYSLLNEGPRAQKDDPHKHLEQFSWAQILSPESSTFQAENRDDVDIQNGVAESQKQHDTTDATYLRTGVRNAVEHRSDELLLEQADDGVVERWGERQVEKHSSEESSSQQSPLSSDMSSFGESEASCGELGPDARRRQVKKRYEEASFDVSSNYESEASYDVWGLVDSPLQTRQMQTASNEEHYSERSHQLSLDVSFYEGEVSYDLGRLLDRPLQTSDTRKRQLQISREEQYPDSYESEASYYIGSGRTTFQDGHPLQRDSSMMALPYPGLTTGYHESPFDSYESEASYYFGAYLDGHPLQRDSSMMSLPCPVVNPHGSASILLRHLVRVDVTPGGAVCIHHVPGNSVVTANSTGEKTCVFHPNSRVFQDGPVIHVLTRDSRIAKICEKGVVFALYSTTKNRMAYRVDESGTKTTVDKFFDMRDVLVPMGVFCDELGDRSLERCCAMVATAAHQTLPNGDDVWTIGDVKIKQDRYGNVEVYVGDSRRHVDVNSDGHVVEDAKGHVAGDARGHVDDSRRQADVNYRDHVDVKARDPVAGDARDHIGDSRRHVDGDSGRHVISVSPVSGEIFVKTPRFSANVGCHATRYLSVRMGNRKVSCGVGGLTAVYGSQKAGLDPNGKVVIF